MIILCTLATVSGYIPKRKQGFESKICVFVGTAALFTTANGWKQPNSPQTEEKTNKMQAIHTLSLEREKKSST